jgi:WD repeat-containing protein 48
MPASTRRRVSYVIPPPDVSVPQFQLPAFAVRRNGVTGPLLLAASKGAQNTPDEQPKGARHPRHRLGVVSLALDTCTQLAGRNAPEGILYTGARDGLVCSWDLELPMKKREVAKLPKGLRKGGGRWETMTGWGDNAIDEEAEDGDDRLRSDGDIIGDVDSARKRRRGNPDGSIPYEFQWETDLDAYQPRVGETLSVCDQNTHHMYSSQLNSDNAHKLTLIG